MLHFFMKNPEKSFEDLVKETRGHFQEAGKKLEPLIRDVPSKTSRMESLYDEIRLYEAERDQLSDPKGKDSARFTGLNLLIMKAERERDKIIREGSISSDVSQS